MLREHLGLMPVEARENIFTPSPAACSIMKKSGSGYRRRAYDAPYEGEKRVLVICTEQELLKTENGAYFLTGNNPVEMLVPLLHLEQAGFKYDLATPTGRPVKLEQWAIPPDEEAFDDILQRTSTARALPLPLPDAIEKMIAGDYIALFVPGGHGAVLGLPQDRNVRAILEYFKANDLHIVSLCHGPAAFLSAAGDAADHDYIFKGYTIAAFPDFVDRQLPRVGYLPGQMQWLFGARLEALGVDIVPSLGTGRTHVDRQLITGDGPLAADKLGGLAAEALLEAARTPDFDDAPRPVRPVPPH